MYKIMILRTPQEVQEHEAKGLLIDVALTKYLATQGFSVAEVHHQERTVKGKPIDMGNTPHGHLHYALDRVLTIGLDTVRLHEYRLSENGRRTKTLGHSDWVRFNQAVNSWLDSHRLSADVKSSSYVIRLKPFRSRLSYTDGYHGVNDSWATDPVTPIR